METLTVCSLQRPYGHVHTPLPGSRPQFSYPFLGAGVCPRIIGEGELASAACMDWYQLGLMLSLGVQLPASIPATHRKGL